MALTRATIIAGAALASAIVVGLAYPLYSESNVLSPIVSMLLAATLGGGLTWILTWD